MHKLKIASIGGYQVLSNSVKPNCPSIKLRYLASTGKNLMSSGKMDTHQLKAIDKQALSIYSLKITPLVFFCRLGYNQVLPT